MGKRTEDHVFELVHELDACEHCCLVFCVHGGCGTGCVEECGCFVERTLEVIRMR
jgi:hypothetical protein